MERGTVASSEEQLDAIERPVRDAFAGFMAGAALAGTGGPLFGLTFRTGGMHFAAKALEFVPADVNIVVAGTNLTSAERDFLHRVGRPVFNSAARYDNELVYEMLMANASGAFGWIDADCFVVNPSIWDAMLAPMAADVGAHTAFTYEPLGFAKSVLPLFSARARDLLTEAGTTLNSYALEPTNVGRAAPHSISRILQERHHLYLRDVLGVDAEGELRPHDGFLDIYDNGRTVNTRKRAQARQWFGPGVRSTGWLIDTPMMAEVALRAHGFATKRVVPTNKEISQDVIHVGASSYRERMRQEGASIEYVARFQLTDLFEVLLADELTQKGAGGAYSELSESQRRRLHDEAGIREDAIKPAARAMLEAETVNVAALADDPRFQFLF